MSPAFDPALTKLTLALLHPRSPTLQVIFVLGGPGAVSDLSFVHLSAGDLLRAEQQRPDSEYGAMIKDYIKEGKIVPMEVTIKLLENAMREKIDAAGEGKVNTFLIDGFPRQMDQAVKFDESVCLSSMVLFLVCPEDKLMERLLKRGETSGRDDDNVESIKKRFQTFITTSMPVVEYYKKQNKVIEIDSSKSVDDVHADIIKGMESIIPGITIKA
ncbi:UMP-CMP kinase, partial [Phenoliferia sp. Uapishka_3]